MDDYISKPVEADELNRLLDKYASDKHRSGSECDSPFQTAERDRIAVSATASAGSLPQAEPLHDALDLSVAAKQVAGGPGEIRELAELLQAECPRMIAAIEEAFRTGDGRGLQRAAHTLKGAADVFGARDVVAWSQRIESLAADSKLDEARADFEPLKREVARLEKALAELLGTK
jgi:HPt (histidine-containing phosphotransfer) domain-containing protein